MVGITCNTALTGELEIDGVPMNCPAWCCLDLQDLWMPASVRGSNRVLPTVPGVRPNRKRRTQTDHNLPFIIVGDCDQFGENVAGSMTARFAQLQRNIDFLRANVVDPTNVGDGTRAGTLTMPDGDVRTARLHVITLTPSTAKGGYWVGTLDVSIPMGVFV